MVFQNIMSKIRQWDNIFLKWMMRHVYFMFFQVVLLVIFLFWFVNVFRVIEINFQSSDSLFDQVVLTHSINMTIIVFLLLLNSFWLLYIFNGIQRLGNLIKDLNYHLRSKTPRN